MNDKVKLHDSKPNRLYERIIHRGEELRAVLRLREFLKSAEKCKVTKEIWDLTTLWLNTLSSSPGASIKADGVSNRGNTPCRTEAITSEVTNVRFIARASALKENELCLEELKTKPNPYERPAGKLPHRPKVNAPTKKLK